MLYRTAGQVLLAISVVACEHDVAPTSPDGGLSTAIPAEPAYIAGVVVSRGDRLSGSASMLVAVNPLNLYGSPSAHVTLSGDFRVQWRSGAPATTADLQAGRQVTVWAGPTELRSLPPVVAARVIVIEH